MAKTTFRPDSGETIPNGSSVCDGCGAIARNLAAYRKGDKWGFSDVDRKMAVPASVITHVSLWRIADSKGSGSRHPR